MVHRYAPIATARRFRSPSSPKDRSQAQSFSLDSWFPISFPILSDSGFFFPAWKLFHDTLLTARESCDSIALMNRKLTSSEAAKKVGIHLATLQRWIAAKKIVPPKPTFRGVVGHRLWSATDVESLKKAKGVIYRQGGGRKKGKKKSGQR